MSISRRYSSYANIVCFRYAITKLIEVFGVREIASHEPGSKTPSVVINCMTPGACKSDFDRESTGIAKIINIIMFAVIARTTEVGSRALVAGVAAGQESHGKYMADCRVAEYVTFYSSHLESRKGDANIFYRPGPLVRGSDGVKLQKEVWAQLVRQLESIQPGISQNI